MRAVVQRVTSASVAVNSEVISSISRGLMVLVGIGRDDTPVDVENIAKKILNLRIFDDGSGAMWKKSVKDIDGEVLCVSQFTLLANTTKGNKPDFHRAMTAESSRQMYASFLERISSMYKPEKIKDGRFGAMMSVSLVNEGPVTLTVDSRKFEYVDQPPSGPGSGARTFLTPEAAPSGERVPENATRAESYSHLSKESESIESTESESSELTESSIPE